MTQERDINKILDLIDYEELHNAQRTTSFYHWIEIWYDGEVYFIEREQNTRSQDESGLIGFVCTDRGDHSWLYQDWASENHDGTFTSIDGDHFADEESLIAHVMEHGDWYDHHDYLRSEIERTASQIKGENYVR